MVEDGTSDDATSDDDGLGVGAHQIDLSLDDGLTVRNA
jgi:hypothetical protein